ncbi:type I restriction-modification system subunit M [Vibrio mimicus]|uniref:type I restriction-modification system subunit M n=1 Tax=Vibrio mimicus TaxID=674 RepID=UPI0011DC361E|nr:type I restriction-modification system subunit M [Vibrio mimicus]EJK2114928.1 type I restriction-modification system subunit M [Vibrio navarrensis]EKO3906875.1 type I restriction-modification system subunit M [Vibrio fluvialis]HCG5102762.1 type I restriction-modification system subunit M [Vibrio parahaemolyticus]MBY7883677.1 type I restriction-modification system subunit M [Vibrio fluvialis]TXY29007.1 type I restriction-modification system subunit M [Vibrio mimicus]
MLEEHQFELRKQLWKITNHVRGYMHADTFREYTLGLLFYKYLSENLVNFADELLSEDGLNFVDLDEKNGKGKELIQALREEAIDDLGYFIQPKALFHALTKEGQTSESIIEKLNTTLFEIENSSLGSGSEQDFYGLFDELDFNSNSLGRSPSQRNTLIVQIMTDLDVIQFDFNSNSSDVLGDAYEYLISMFASNSGKKAGEFYTPQMVSKLLAKLSTLNNDSINSVYDPTCGSGSLLLQVAKESNNPHIKYYAQERNRSTYNLARMNMIMHKVNYREFDIRLADTLESPQHRGLKFDAVVANPPFSMSWAAKPELLKDERFAEYGSLAPKAKADFAFIQHMLYQLSEHGTMAVVVPHGVLFRKGAEGRIRQFLIQEKNCLDAVIGLPANIFYGTGIPTCILVFKKKRQNSNNVLFIDASQSYKSGSKQNHISEEDILSIINSTIQRENIKNFAAVVSVSELEENDYNLNISRYVDASPQALYLQGLKEQLQEFEPSLLYHNAQQILHLRTDDSEKTFENALILPRILGRKPYVSSNSLSNIKHSGYALIFNEQEINAEYLELFYNSKVGQTILEDCAAKAGGTMKTLNLESLKNNLIASIPSLDIQKACVESNRTLNTIRKQLDVYQEDMIFRPSFSKELLIRLDTTSQYVEKANYEEQLLQQIRVGENAETEFKETFSLDVRRSQTDSNYKFKKESHIEESSLKTLAGFLNSSGGTLFIGVTDDQKIKGLEKEFAVFHQKSADKFLLHFKNKVKDMLGESFYPFIKIDLETIQLSTVLVVKCSRANQPCFLGKENKFYVRTPTGATDQLSGREMWDHLRVKFQ